MNLPNKLLKKINISFKSFSIGFITDTTLIALFLISSLTIPILPKLLESASNTNLSRIAETNNWPKNDYECTSNSGGIKAKQGTTTVQTCSSDEICTTNSTTVFCTNIWDFCREGNYLTCNQDTRRDYCKLYQGYRNEYSSSGECRPKDGLTVSCKNIPKTFCYSDQKCYNDGTLNNTTRTYWCAVPGDLSEGEKSCEGDITKCAQGLFCDSSSNACRTCIEGVSCNKPQDNFSSVPQNDCEYTGTNLDPSFKCMVTSCSGNFSQNAPAYDTACKNAYNASYVCCKASSPAPNGGNTPECPACTSTQTCVRTETNSLSCAQKASGKENTLCEDENGNVNYEVCSSGYSCKIAGTRYYCIKNTPNANGGNGAPNSNPNGGNSSSGGNNSSSGGLPPNAGGTNETGTCAGKGGINTSEKSYDAAYGGYLGPRCSTPPSENGKYDSEKAKTGAFCGKTYSDAWKCNNGSIDYDAYPNLTTCTKSPEWCPANTNGNNNGGNSSNGGNSGSGNNTTNACISSGYECRSNNDVGTACIRNGKTGSYQVKAGYSNSCGSKSCLVCIVPQTTITGGTGGNNGNNTPTCIGTNYICELSTFQGSPCTRDGKPGTYRPKGGLSCTGSMCFECIANSQPTTVPTSSINPGGNGVNATGQACTNEGQKCGGSNSNIYCNKAKDSTELRCCPYGSWWCTQTSKCVIAGTTEYEFCGRLSPTATPTPSGYFDPKKCNGAPGSYTNHCNGTDSSGNKLPCCPGYHCNGNPNLATTACVKDTASTQSSQSIAESSQCSLNTDCIKLGKKICVINSLEIGACE